MADLLGGDRSDRGLVLVGVRAPSPFPASPGRWVVPEVEAWLAAVAAMGHRIRAWRLDLVHADPDDLDPLLALVAVEDDRPPALVLDELRRAGGPNAVRTGAWAYRALGPAVFAPAAPAPVPGRTTVSSPDVADDVADDAGGGGAPFPAATVYLIGNNVAPGGEVELHRWYDHVHVPDTFEHLGFVAARRFWRRADPVEAAEHAHLIAYGVPQGGIEACERRRLALARERVEAAREGRPPLVPVPDVVMGPRWAGYFVVRPLAGSLADRPR